MNPIDRTRSPLHENQTDQSTHSSRPSSQRTRQGQTQSPSQARLGGGSSSPTSRYATGRNAASMQTPTNPPAPRLPNFTPIARPTQVSRVEPEHFELAQLINLPALPETVRDKVVTAYIRYMESVASHNPRNVPGSNPLTNEQHRIYVDRFAQRLLEFDPLLVCSLNDMLFEQLKESALHRHPNLIHVLGDKPLMLWDYAIAMNADNSLVFCVPPGAMSTLFERGNNSTTAHQAKLKVTPAPSDRTTWDLHQRTLFQRNNPKHRCYFADIASGKHTLTTTDHIILYKEQYIELLSAALISPDQIPRIALSHTEHADLAASYNAAQPHVSAALGKRPHALSTRTSQLPPTNQPQRNPSTFESFAPFGNRNIFAVDDNRSVFSFNSTDAVYSPNSAKRARTDSVEIIEIDKDAKPAADPFKPLPHTRANGPSTAEAEWDAELSTLFIENPDIFHSLSSSRSVSSIANAFYSVQSEDSTARNNLTVDNNSTNQSQNQNLNHPIQNEPAAATQSTEKPKASPAAATAQSETTRQGTETASATASHVPQKSAIDQLLDQIILPGINPKYVMPEAEAIDYRRNRRLEVRLLKAFERSEKPAALPHLLGDTFSRQDKKSSETLFTTVGDYVNGMSHRSLLARELKTETVNLPPVTRDYIHSKTLKVIYPVKQNAAESYQPAKHCHFVMAYRALDALTFPDPEDLGSVHPITPFFVMTQNEFDIKWMGCLPLHCGAVLLEDTQDNSINHRRFAAQMAARDMMQQFDTQLISFSDDNIQKTRHLREAFAKAAEQAKAGEHALYSFPNKGQRQKDGYTSGKLLLATANVFNHINQPALMIPPSDLFYQDLWMLQVLSLQAKLNGIEIECQVGGDLTKSPVQAHVARDRYNQASETPPASTAAHSTTPTARTQNQTTAVDCWKIPAGSLTFIDEFDKKLFLKMQQHLLSAATTIRSHRDRLANSLEARISKEKLSSLYDNLNPAKKLAPGTEAPELRDYQRFIGDEMKAQIFGPLHRSSNPKGSYSATLEMATGTGKTFTLLAILEGFFNTKTATNATITAAAAAQAPQQPSPKRCLVITPSIDIGKNLLSGIRKHPDYINRVLLMCSDDKALSTKEVLQGSWQQSDGMILIAVQDSVQNIIESNPEFLNRFGAFVFEESHMITESLMNDFDTHRQGREDKEPVLTLQMTATPKPHQSKAGYLGNTHFHCHYDEKVAQQRRQIRDVNYVKMIPDYKMFASPDQIVKEILGKVNRIPQYENKPTRIICYVENSDVAAACQRYVETHHPEHSSFAYCSKHSTGTERHSALAHFQTEGTERVKILFPVRMLRAATDLKGGVDFLFYMKNTLRDDDKIQIRGRAYREPIAVHKNTPAYFYDYSFNLKAVSGHSRGASSSEVQSICTIKASRVDGTPDYESDRETAAGVTPQPITVNRNRTEEWFKQIDLLGRSQGPQT